MSQPMILVLDLGTSRLKAVLFTPDGHEYTSAAVSYPTHTPQQEYAEQSPDDWWSAACRATQALWEKGADPKRVAMISVTGQMHGIVPVDGQNTPLTPCLTLRDRRASHEAAEIRHQIGVERIFQLTGARLDSTAPPAKLLWFYRQETLWSKIQVFLAPKDWLRQQLTGGHPVTDIIEAAGMGLYDVIHAGWSPEMAHASLTPIERLPSIQAATDVAGSLTPGAAAQLGLLPGIPIAVGAADDVEFIGAGLLRSGDCMEHLGSTGSLVMVVDHPIEDPSGTLELYPHLIPGCWIAGGSTSNGGSALEWFRAALKHESPLKLETTTHPPPVFIPYLAGERAPVWEPDARAVFWGLGLEHDQAHLVRAVFEGVAFSLRHLLEALEEVCGQVQDIIRVGASNDLNWLKLRADVYDRPLCPLIASDPTALGAALVGACALGVYPDLVTAVQTAVTLDGDVHPSPSSDLNARYQMYRTLSTWTRDLLGERKA